MKKHSSFFRNVTSALAFSSLFALGVTPMSFAQTTSPGTTNPGTNANSGKAGQAAGQKAGQAAGQKAGQAAGQKAGQAAGQKAGQAAGQKAVA